MKNVDLSWPAFWLGLAIVIAAAFLGSGKSTTIKDVDDPIAQRLFACAHMASNTQSSCVSKIMVDIPE